MKQKEAKLDFRIFAKALASDRKLRRYFVEGH